MNRALLRLFFITIISFLSFDVFAQKPEQIKKDKSYYWGEGDGVTIEEAESVALKRLAQNIYTIVIDEGSHLTSDININGRANDCYTVYDSQTKTYTFLTIPNLKKLYLSAEPKAKVFVYISKNEIEEMYQKRREQILSLIETAKTSERKLRIDDALRNYYWAYLLTKANVGDEPVKCEFEGKMENCLTYLPVKIKSVISYIKASVEKCESKNGSYKVLLRFKYNDRDVSGLEISRYQDGYAMVGPVSVKDGIAELDLAKLPEDEKLHLSYEYKFINQAKGFDPELDAIVDSKIYNSDNFDFKSTVSIPMSVNTDKQTLKPDKDAKKGIYPDGSCRDLSISPEPVAEKQRLQDEPLKDTGPYAEIIKYFEKAIKTRNPQILYNHCNLDAYKLIDTLLTKTGKISLIGSIKPDYSFAEANGLVMCRYIPVKIKYSNGRTFNEKIVVRFDKQTKKISSVAFALSNKAEADILNEKSRLATDMKYTLLQFMEDYQTAYALKRLGYINRIFSEDALIITGTVLKTSNKSMFNDRAIELFSNSNIRYNKFSKTEYLKKLTQRFKGSNYIHLTYEDNESRVMPIKGLPIGSAVVIQLRQFYCSQSYSDVGYLTLIIDISDADPVINIRFWQPNMVDFAKIDDVIDIFRENDTY